jgi:hypothetical protein
LATKLIVSTQFNAIDRFTQVVKKMSMSTTNFANKAVMNFKRVDMASKRMVSNVAKSIGKLGLQVGVLALGMTMITLIGIFADFEQANASLSSVMSSGTEVDFKILSNDAKRLGAITAKTATEVVGLQEAFARLGFERPEIVNMTEATIAGSIAMKGELADTAELVGAMVKSFDDFESINAPSIIDQMTLATQKSALNFEQLQTALPIVAGAANAAGIPFNKLTALLGKLSDAGIDASSSSTALRNIFIESAAQGLNYEQILEKIQKNQDKLTAANDEFGKRGAVSAVILAKNLKGVNALSDSLLKASKASDKAGKSIIAITASEKQLNTLTGKLTLLGSAWAGFILSLEDGNGAFSEFLKTSVDVISEILALATGTAIAEDKMTNAQKSIRGFAETGLFLLKTVKNLIIGFVVFKAIMLAAKIATIAYNVVGGITIALTKGATVAANASKVALVAQSITLGIVSAAQWLWNAAMSAGAIAMTILTAPITLIILGIAAMVALVILIINKWNDWGAALALFLGPLGLIISMIQSFRRNWDMIKESFSEGGILSGLKAIGATILDAILMPLQQVFKLLVNIPGVGKFAQRAVDGIQSFREELGVNLETDESGEPLNADATKEKVRTERTIQEKKQSSTLNINNNTGNEAELINDNGMNINLTNTMAFQ